MTWLDFAFAGVLLCWFLLCWFLLWAHMRPREADTPLWDEYERAIENARNMTKALVEARAALESALESARREECKP